MSSEQSPLIPDTQSNNYVSLDRERERLQQNASVTDDARDRYTHVYPHLSENEITRSSSDYGDDVELLTDSDRFVVLHSSTNIESMMNFMKGMLGTGILAIPAAFKYSGLWVGFCGLGLLGILNAFCMNTLVNCSTCLRARTGMVTMNYSDVAEQAFKTGPRPLRKLASFSWVIVNVFLCMTQFGFCIVYVLFVANTIKQIVDELTSVDLSLPLYMFFMVLLLLPFMFVRNLKHMAPFSMLANFLMFGGIVVIIQHCVQSLPGVRTYPPAFGGWETLPLYFGIALYAFEGIGVVLPIENNMKRRQDFGGWTGVLTTGMVIVVVMFMTLGFYGYLVYQDDVEGTITLNLPTDSWLFILTKLGFAIVIFITYGIQFYVPIQILWPLVRSRLTPESWHCRNGELILRFVFVMCTFGIAATLPHLELMISFVGAFSSSAIALIFPPIIHVVTFWQTEGAFGCCRWKLVIHAAIGLFGFCGFVTGTAVTIMQLVQTFESDGYEYY